MTIAWDEHKKRATFATLLIIALVIWLILFLGLWIPVPLPEDEGAMIELGWTDEGSGNVESFVANAIPVVQPPQPVQDNTPVPTQEAEEEVVTEEESEISTPVEKVTPKPTPLPKPEPEPEVSNELQEAMNNVWNAPSGGGNEGENEDATGNLGKPEGSVDGKGVMGGSGNKWELAGRGFLGGAKVEGKPTEEGRVVLNIKVDRLGNVVSASVNMGESNTTSNQLINLAKKAALKAKFNADASAAIEQRGKLTFFFILQ